MNITNEILNKINTDFLFEESFTLDHISQLMHTVAIRLKADFSCVGLMTYDLGNTVLKFTEYPQWVKAELILKEDADEVPHQLGTLMDKREVISSISKILYYGNAASLLDAIQRASDEGVSSSVVVKTYYEKLAPHLDRLEDKDTDLKVFHRSLKYLVVDYDLNEEMIRLYYENDNELHVTFSIYSDGSYHIDENNYAKAISMTNYLFHC